MKTAFSPYVTFREIMFNANWKCNWSRQLKTDDSQPFCHVEHWQGPKPGQTMLAQIWPDDGGITTYFRDSGETWTDLEHKLSGTT